MNAADLKLGDVVRIGDGEVLWWIKDVATWRVSGQCHRALLHSLDLDLGARTVPLRVRTEPVSNLRPVDAITRLGHLAKGT